MVICSSLYRGLESRNEYLRKKYKKEIRLIVADICDTDTFVKTLEQYKRYGIVHTAVLKAVGESMEKPDEGEVNKFLAVPAYRGASLRFFNVVGTAAPKLLDNSVENLVSVVINKLKAGQQPIIYGTDYPTLDGTCVRDYVDVRDIARTHLATADSTATLPLAMNVGTGHGGFFREVIKLVCAAAGLYFVVVEEQERRAGDPAFLCADVSSIKSAIGFNAEYSLEASTESLF